jgi:hypothetical protein
VRVAFPSSSDHLATRFIDGRRIDRFDSVEVEATGPLTASVRATGDSPQGRGNLGPIPLMIEWEGSQVGIGPGNPFRWTFTARPLP